MMLCMSRSIAQGPQGIDFACTAPSTGTTTVGERAEKGACGLGPLPLEMA